MLNVSKVKDQFRGKFKLFLHNKIVAKDKEKVHSFSFKDESTIAFRLS